MKRFVWCLIWLLACGAFPLCVQAQEDGFVTLKVYVFNRGGKSNKEISDYATYIANHKDKALEDNPILGEAKSVYYYRGGSRADAEKKYNTFLERLKGSEQSNRGDNYDDIIKRSRFESSSNGTIEFSDASPGECVVVTSELDFNTCIYITIEKGKKTYIGTLDINALQEFVSNLGWIKRNPKSSGGGDDTDKEQTFRINIFLPKGLAKETSRLIVQPFAVRIEDGDTVDYPNPIVYEGPYYHQTQEKRMAYDYENKDSLGKYLSTTIQLRGDRDIIIDTTFTYHKRKHDWGKKFRAGTHTWTLEDYHHVYQKMAYLGSYPNTPLKFVDFSDVMDTLNINDFHIDLTQRRIPQERNLNLRFKEAGSWELAEDSVNIIEKQKLLNELASYGDLLDERATLLIAGASPEGSDAFNEKLAQRRAETAKRLVGIQGAKTKTRVYTWNDVCDSLHHRGLQEESAQVQAIINRYKSQDAMDKDIMQLPFYKNLIEPILVRQRSISCSYSYVEMRYEEPWETNNRFRKYKAEGKLDQMGLTLSDCRNLFKGASAEDQDLVTELAYKAVLRRPNYWEEPFSFYVANRMAILNNKRDTPDSTVLKPFIFYGYGLNQYKYIGNNSLKYNCKEMVVNQAITYMKMGEDSLFYKYVGWLQEILGEDNEQIKALTSTANFKKFFPREGSLTDEQQQSYNKAKDYLLQQGDNRAVLYTEVDRWGLTNVADTLVNSMDDENPKKWYLKALLIAYKTDLRDIDKKYIANASSLLERKKIVVPGFEDFIELTPEADDSLRQKDPGAWSKYNDRLIAYDEARKQIEAEEDEQISQNNVTEVPHYMAYFQHSFDLQPRYLNYYLEEGHIGDDLRKKYKFKVANMDVYRKLFDRLRKEDAKKTASVNSVQSEGKAAETEVEIKQEDTETKQADGPITDQIEEQKENKEDEEN